MSFFKTTKQGGSLVIRDEAGKVVKATPIRPEVTKRMQTWRAQMRALDTTGIDDLIALRNIGYGVPRKVMNPEDGTYTWDVPSISDQRQALTTIVELRFGKAVAATEIVKAEAEAEEQEQYAALTNEALLEAARPFLERVERGLLPEGEDE